MSEVIVYAIIISLVTIIIRVIWVFPGAYIPRWLFRSIQKKEPNPGWRSVLLVGWSGMRGVVSLAAALAIPLTLSTGESFPHRNLILFITFVVILFTLILQGLSLKPLIRFLKIVTNEQESEKVQSLSMRVQLAEAALNFLNTNYKEETEKNEAYKRVIERYERMVEVAKKKLDMEEVSEEAFSFLPHYRQMLLELIDVRRKQLNSFRRSHEYNEEMIREREWELDLEEARLRG